MLKKMVFLLVMNWALAAVGQELTLTAGPSALSVLPGVPMPVALTVTNMSGRDLWIVGQTLQQGIELREASLLTENGKRPPCEAYSSDGFQAASSAPPSSWPKVLFKKGETYFLQSGIYSQNTCPLEAVPPGRYTGKLTVRCRSLEEAGVREISASTEIVVDVCAPSGPDLAFLKALQGTLAVSSPQKPPSYTGQARPLEWAEVLGSPRIRPEKIALSEFPTSTYAAYIIYQRSGAEGLAKSDPTKVAEALTDGMGLMGEIWVPVPTGGDKNGLAPLSGQAAVEWRQKWFGIVLKSHPDIWFADALRLKLAVDQVALKNYQGGQADLEALAKNEKSPMACNAKALLDHLKNKGLIKS